MSAPDAYVIALVGDIDIARYPEMRAAFEAASYAPGPVLVDLGEVHYVDSYFLSELMMFARKCEAMDRPLAVFTKDPYVARTFGLAGVGMKIGLYLDRNLALASLRRAQPSEPPA